MINLLSCMFAQNLNWNDLLAKRIKPPFVPTIVSLGLFSLVLSNGYCNLLFRLFVSLD